jgi:STE24 endopeptidase
MLWCVRTIWSWVVPGLLLFTGLSARLREWARRRSRNGVLVIIFYLLAALAISSLANLPLSFYAGFVRQHAYGLSNQTLGKWCWDWAKSLLVLAVMGSAVLWLPYLLLRKTGKHWWWLTGSAAIPFMLLAVVVAPVWIDPLFNHFGPMKDPRLEADLLALAHQAGIPGSRVFEVDKSADTKALNAYVTGAFGTKRIVVWDTLVARLDREELLAVMGHEMGHYVLHHVWWGMALAAVFVFGSLFGVHCVGDRLARRFKNRIGFDHLADIASLPLLVLLFRLAWFLLLPAGNAVSRHCEHEADRFALDLTHRNHAAATAFVKLQQGNLGVPWPGFFYKLWRATHPPTGERIEFCNSYQPWAQAR